MERSHCGNQVFSTGAQPHARNRLGVSHGSGPGAWERKEGSPPNSSVPRWLALPTSCNWRTTGIAKERSGAARTRRRGSAGAEYCRGHRDSEWERESIPQKSVRGFPGVKSDLPCRKCSRAACVPRKKLVSAKRGKRNCRGCRTNSVSTGGPSIWPEGA